MAQHSRVMRAVGSKRSLASASLEQDHCRHCHHQTRLGIDGKLFADKQTTEFPLLKQGGADFAMGSTI